MAMKLENINNLISDDLAKRNENWTEIDNTFALKANKQQEAWITPTLLNGWINNLPSVYDSAGYFKDSTGNVVLKGFLEGGTAPSDCFILPIGYRPPRRLSFTVFGYAGYVGQVRILEDGTVRIMRHSLQTDLCGIRFRVV